ncbi:hypothetical protein Tco_0439416 [Tanacetum coccineum]
METSKPLLWDAEAEDVDVYLYRSLIGSLMYLTASRPDITFAVCACTRFQVTPKVSHLHDVKRIFRYLKELERMRYENLTQKLTFYKALFSPQWKFLIHTILQCLGAKTTDWNEFSSTMASAIIYETEDVESVPMHSNDPLLSGEDRLKLNELMELCTNLSQRVLDLENTKTSQVAEITKLKERVKKLERRNKSRTLGHKRLRKVGRSAQVVSSNDEDPNRYQSIKPKDVTTTATTTTTAVTRPKARGVVVREPSEFRTTTSSSQTSQLPQVKDKGKAKLIEHEKPLKKKDQILVDEEIAQRLQEEFQAEKEEEDNLISWDNTQAMM